MTETKIIEEMKEKINRGVDDENTLERVQKVLRELDNETKFKALNELIEAYLENNRRVFLLEVYMYDEFFEDFVTYYMFYIDMYLHDSRLLSIFSDRDIKKEEIERRYNLVLKDELRDITYEHTYKTPGTVKIYELKLKK